MLPAEVMVQFWPVYLISGSSLSMLDHTLALDCKTKRNDFSTVPGKNWLWTGWLKFGKLNRQYRLLWSFWHCKEDRLQKTSSRKIVHAFVRLWIRVHRSAALMHAGQGETPGKRCLEAGTQAPLACAHGRGDLTLRSSVRVSLDFPSPMVFSAARCFIERLE